jgi:hypothetical protein
MSSKTRSRPEAKVDIASIPTALIDPPIGGSTAELEAFLAEMRTWPDRHLCRDVEEEVEEELAKRRAHPELDAPARSAAE